MDFGIFAVSGLKAARHGSTGNGVYRIRTLGEPIVQLMQNRSAVARQMQNLDAAGFARADRDIRFSQRQRLCQKRDQRLVRRTFNRRRDQSQLEPGPPLRIIGDSVHTVA